MGKEKLTKKAFRKVGEASLSFVVNNFDEDKTSLSKSALTKIGTTSLEISASGCFLLWGKPKQTPKFK